MATSLSAGQLYKIDLDDGKPAHYWVLLTDPDSRGRFAVVSFTDSRKFMQNSFVWPQDYAIGLTFRLQKESVLRIDKVLIRSRGWLEKHKASRIDECSLEVIDRVRCNVADYKHLIQPEGINHLKPFFDKWKSDCRKFCRSQNCNE